MDRGLVYSRVLPPPKKKKSPLYVIKYVFQLSTFIKSIETWPSLHFISDM